MILVRIAKDWEKPDLLQQTPGHSGEWNGIQYTLESIEQCDYTVILNKPDRDIVVECPKKNVWAIIQEPPNEMFKIYHRGDKAYSRIYTTDEDLELIEHTLKNYGELAEKYLKMKR